MNSTTILNKIQENTPLDFGTIFNKSIELFKKSWSYGILLLIATLLISIPFFLLIYIPMLGMGLYGRQMESNYELFRNISPVVLVGFIGLFLLALLIVSVIGFAMKAGFYKIVKDIDEGKEGTAADLFRYIKLPYLAKITAISLMTVGISIVATLLCFLPLIYVMVPLSLTMVVFAYNPELSASEVIKTSFSLGTKKWLITFGLMLVSSILAEIVGLLLCGIGILFTASFAYLPSYFVYKQTVGFEEEKKEDTGAMEAH